MDPFGEAISRLSDTVIYVARTTSQFKPQLAQLKVTLDRITPILSDIQNQNRHLDRTEDEQNLLVKEIDDAQQLVNDCLKIKWNLFKRFTYSRRLKKVDQQLLRFFQLEFQALQYRDIQSTLEELKAFNARDLHLRCGTTERHKLGWRVPPKPRGVLGFEEPLREVKAKVLSDTNVHGDDISDIHDDDSGGGKVVVISAAGGFGKTTLAKMLVNDTQIQDVFGENIFFVTASETPDFMASVSDLLNPDCYGQHVKFQGPEDAKNKLGHFLREKLSGPILVVLDDVWADSYINNFKFDIQSYTLLVTTRMKFRKYDQFKLDCLNDEDAQTLFRRSAMPGSAIDENIVNEMVKYCKRHPLTLSVVGGSLNGRNVSVWLSMIKSLAEGESMLDLNQEVLYALERSFEVLEDKFKQAFLDFGMFLEDERIPAVLLLDMWVQMYKHDDEGVDTLATIHELSDRNLVTLVDAARKRKGRYAKFNTHCAHKLVSQHDLLRQLAVNLNSKLPIAKRPRLSIREHNGLLITNVQGSDEIESVQEVKDPMQARILSISTGESFNSNWFDMSAPDVEVMLLDFKSNGYILPHFLNQMRKLKILAITTPGYYRRDIEGCHVLASLSNLTRIRLGNVVIPSLGGWLFGLVNLEKVSFRNCDMRDAFEDVSVENHVWPKLAEFEMDRCYNLKVYPRMLCYSIHPRKINMTCCSDLSVIPEDVGNLIGLETLILYGSIHLRKLPKSLSNLPNLSVLDISGCVKLKKLPKRMGSFGGTLYMDFVTGVKRESVESQLSNAEVVFNTRFTHIYT